MRLVFDFGDEIHVSPPIWPDQTLNIEPGDLSQFAPQGNGVYGYQFPKSFNPFKYAPQQEPAGGIIYFGCDIKRVDLDALLRILEVKSDWKDYAVFIAESKKPGKDSYLTQMRIVSRFGLRFMFGAISDRNYDSFPDQKVSIAEGLWAFMEIERKRWGISFMEDGKKGLRGLFGGDGHFAREELAFGFMVENHYHNVYRIWSRAWLVTK